MCMEYGSEFVFTRLQAIFLSSVKRENFKLNSICQKNPWISFSSLSLVQINLSTPLLLVHVQNYKSGLGMTECHVSKLFHIEK